MITIRGLPPGMKIFLADRSTDWKSDPDHMFMEQDGKYTIDVPGKKKQQFKLFFTSHGEEADRMRQVRKALADHGFVVTGEGDVAEGHIRTWFYLKFLPTYGDGVYKNNVWPRHCREVFVNPQRIVIERE
jgi:hypothetical protein